MHPDISKVAVTRGAKGALETVISAIVSWMGLAGTGII
jgi:hypothetical protein